MSYGAAQVRPKQLSQLFSGCEGFVTVSLAVDEATGQCKGFGHVLFERERQPFKAAERMAKAEISGKLLRCDANPKARTGAYTDALAHMHTRPHSSRTRRNAYDRYCCARRWCAADDGTGRGGMGGGGFRGAGGRGRGGPPRF